MRALPRMRAEIIYLTRYAPREIISLRCPNTPRVLRSISRSLILQPSICRFFARKNRTAFERINTTVANFLYCSKERIRGPGRESLSRFRRRCHSRPRLMRTSQIDPTELEYRPSHNFRSPQTLSTYSMHSPSWLTRILVSFGHLDLISKCPNRPKRKEVKRTISSASPVMKMSRKWKRSAKRSLKIKGTENSFRLLMRTRGKAKSPNPILTMALVLWESANQNFQNLLGINVPILFSQLFCFASEACWL